MKEIPPPTEAPIIVPLSLEPMLVPGCKF